MKARRRVLLCLVSFVLPRLAFAAGVTPQQLDEARAKIAGLQGQVSGIESQKQQVQGQYDAQIAAKHQEIGQFQAKILWQEGRRALSGAQAAATYDLDAAADAAMTKEEIRGYKKKIKLLTAEAQRLNAERDGKIAALDTQAASINAQIFETEKILSLPTQGDLERQKAEIEARIRQQEAEVEYLRGRGADRRDIDDARWILENERRRRNGVDQQIRDGEFIEGGPTESVETAPPEPPPQPPPTSRVPAVAPAGPPAAGGTLEGEQAVLIAGIVELEKKAKAIDALTATIREKSPQLVPLAEAAKTSASSLSAVATATKAAEKCDEATELLASMSEDASGASTKAENLATALPTALGLAQNCEIPPAQIRGIHSGAMSTLDELNDDLAAAQADNEDVKSIAFMMTAAGAALDQASADFEAFVNLRGSLAATVKEVFEASAQRYNDSQNLINNEVNAMFRQIEAAEEKLGQRGCFKALSDRVMAIRLDEDLGDAFAKIDGSDTSMMRGSDEMPGQVRKAIEEARGKLCTVAAGDEHVALLVAAVAQAVGAIEGAKDLPTLADECEKKGTSVTEDEGEEEEGGEEEEEQVTQGTGDDEEIEEGEEEEEEEVEDGDDHEDDNEANLEDEEPEFGENGQDDGSDDERGDGTLGEFVDDNEAEESEETTSDYGAWQGSSEVTEASTSGDATVEEAEQIVDGAGHEAQETQETSAGETAGEDSRAGWGATLGGAVAEGVQDGMEQAAEGFGGAAADASGDDIFGPGSDEEGHGEGEEAEEPGEGGASTSGADDEGEDEETGGTGGGGGGKYYEYELVCAACCHKWKEGTSDPSNASPGSCPNCGKSEQHWRCISPPDYPDSGGADISHCDGGTLEEPPAAEEPASGSGFEPVPGAEEESPPDATRWPRGGEPVRFPSPAR